MISLFLYYCWIGSLIAAFLYMYKCEQYAFHKNFTLSRPTVKHSYGSLLITTLLCALVPTSPIISTITLIGMMVIETFGLKFYKFDKKDFINSFYWKPNTSYYMCDSIENFVDASKTEHKIPWTNVVDGYRISDNKPT